MRHFHRTSLHPDQVLATADAFFPTSGLRPAGETARSRTFTGVVGTPEVPSTLELSVRSWRRPEPAREGWIRLRWDL